MMHRFRDESDEFVDRLISSMRDAIPSVQINTYVSHQMHRRSYHIVLLGCFANTQYECVHKVQRIIAYHNDNYRMKHGIIDHMTKYIDMSVYKNNQLFRLLGSRKIDTDNTKRIYKCDVHYSNTLDQLRFSLISISVTDMENEYRTT